MAIPYMLLYHVTSYAPGLEWATKYHFDTPGEIDDSKAVQVAEAEAELCHTGITFNRWEGFDASGHKFTDGSLSTVGLIGGTDMMPIQYAILLRLSTGPLIERPSVRYIHGWSEGFQSNNSTTAAFTTALNAYQTAMAAVGGYVDSDGLAVNTHLFRKFTRRRRMRRIAL